MSKKEIVIADVVDKYDNPIAELVQVACQFSSSLYLVRGNHRINAKSIMGIMAFNPHNGVEVEIEADGADEAEALTAMEKFLLCMYLIVYQQFKKASECPMLFLLVRKL